MGTEAVEDPKPNSNLNPEGTTKVSHYEQCREERIKENRQRMQNLGILNLSQKLKSETRPVKRRYRNPNPAQKSTPPPTQPSRRSSRLENTAPVVYNEGKNVKGKKKSNQESVIVIGEGPRAEIYTEEHEKLLGNTERSWTCFVDGYDKDGKRIYDPVKGKTCHQCRQKTLGYRTQCSECDLVQGQFCGDCLYMRYGEHVLEALENPNWICPACRGICNCSLCRNHKGWVPTGPIYRKIAQLGYKSVAHYLVQTKRVHTDDATLNQGSAKRSLSFQEAKIADDDDLPEEVQKLQDMEDQNGDFLKQEESENPNSAEGSLSFKLIKRKGKIADDEEVQKLQNIEDQDGDFLNKEDPNKNQNGYLPEEEVPNGDFLKQEESENPNSAEMSLSFMLIKKKEKVADDVDRLEEVPKLQGMKNENDDFSMSFLLRRVDVQVLSYLEPPTQDKQEDSCAHIGDHSPKTEEMTQTLVVKTENQDLCDGTETRGGNSATVRETRRKRKAALEPNQDSIGGRLRQRRRSQSGL